MDRRFGKRAWSGVWRYVKLYDTSGIRTMKRGWMDQLVLYFRGFLRLGATGACSQGIYGVVSFLLRVSKCAAVVCRAENSACGAAFY